MRSYGGPACGSWLPRAGATAALRCATTTVVVCSLAWSRRTVYGSMLPVDVDELVPCARDEARAVPLREKAGAWPTKAEAE